MYQFYELGYVPSDRDKGTNSYFAMASGLGAPRNQFVASLYSTVLFLSLNDIMELIIHPFLPSRRIKQDFVRSPLTRLHSQSFFHTRDYCVPHLPKIPPQNTPPKTPPPSI